tara:strand:- start:557 stop:745 length:189 start_codon:yes stop_codon:yes gene_type:complete
MAFSETAPFETCTVPEIVGLVSKSKSVSSATFNSPELASIENEPEGICSVIENVTEPLLVLP